MISRLKFNEWPYPIIAQMDLRFKVLGNGITLEVGRQPTEVRPVFRPILAIQQSDKLLEITWAQRDPYAPDKWFICAMHGNFDATSDEEVLTIDDACIFCLFTTSRPLSLGRK